MKRLHADLLLLLAALIWGFAFVAQKDALLYIGPLAFVASRFFLSFIVTLPLALRERRHQRVDNASVALPRWPLASLCAVFAAGVILQQWGLATTTATNAGFLTGLYVLFVPLICFLCLKHKLPAVILPAAVLCVIGAYLLSGGGQAFGRGDILVLLCAVFFALHVVLAGRILSQCKMPFQVSCVQYGAVCLLAFAAMVAFETPDMAGMRAAAVPILYAGLVSGGVAYTLQMVAQQHAPPSDTAVILSAESVFAALGGFLLLGERLSPMGIAGCGLIIAAILMVELVPLYLRRRKPATPAPLPSSSGH